MDHKESKLGTIPERRHINNQIAGPIINRDGKIHGISLWTHKIPEPQPRGCGTNSRKLMKTINLEQNLHWNND